MGVPRGTTYAVLQQVLDSGRSLLLQFTRLCRQASTGPGILNFFICACVHLCFSSKAGPLVVDAMTFLQLRCEPPTETEF